jgi:arsenical pump membrane protein
MVLLVLVRPSIGRLRITPAVASAGAVAVLLGGGLVGPADLERAFFEIWRGLVGVTAIMVTAAVAHRLGLLERLAAVVEQATRGAVYRAFAVVFFLSALSAAALNNDTAVLLLAPTIAVLIKRRYPVRPYLVVPFSFAVFAAAGVAPLVISNPMNLVVAEYAGITFNEYAARMLPVALVGWLCAFLVLRRLFHKMLDDEIPGRGPLSPPLPPVSTKEKVAFGLLAATLGTYPVVSYCGGPVWAVAGSGALAFVLLAWRSGIKPPEVARMVSWDILGFLFGMFVLATALRSVGAVARLTAHYAAMGEGPGQVFGIGVSAALGSAILNNHPMALLNALALHDLPGTSRLPVLAALVGGDLGPRLLPTGSLAGLLWLESLRRLGIKIPLRQFVSVGAAVTAPTLMLSLLVLLLVR